MIKNIKPKICATIFVKDKKTGLIKCDIGNKTKLLTIDEARKIMAKRI